MGRYLELARRALESSPEGYRYEINEIAEKRTADPYQERAREALNKICRPDYPAGLVPWLGMEYPSLYQELTCALPDEIHQMWAEKVPMLEFERILDLWLTAHHTACELYHTAHTIDRVPVTLRELGR